VSVSHTQEVMNSFTCLCTILCVCVCCQFLYLFICLLFVCDLLPIPECMLQPGKNGVVSIALKNLNQQATVLTPIATVSHPVATLINSHEHKQRNDK
jgi:hypothetical protein